jgi:TPR repeat protein
MQRVIAALLALSFLEVVPAQAQFYSLEGRFQCLNDPAAICFDASSGWPAPKPDARRVAQPAAAAVAVPPARAVKARPVQLVPQSAPAATDPIREISARLQAGKPAPGDVAILRRAARAGDRRALELLAWCNLKGLGTPRDPLQAYLLYSAAAAMGISPAQQNLARIYEDELTPEQRHQALMIENSVLFPAPQ